MPQVANIELILNMGWRRGGLPKIKKTLKELSDGTLKKKYEQAYQKCVKAKENLQKGIDAGFDVGWKPYEAVPGFEHLLPEKDHPTKAQYAKQEKAKRIDEAKATLKVRDEIRVEMKRRNENSGKKPKFDIKKIEEGSAEAVEKAEAARLNKNKGTSSGVW